MIRLAFAIFLALHGIAHGVGFASSWRLGEFEDAPRDTTVLGGRFDVGTAGIPQCNAPSNQGVPSSERVRLATGITNLRPDHVGLTEQTFTSTSPTRFPAAMTSLRPTSLGTPEAFLGHEAQTIPSTTIPARARAKASSRLAASAAKRWVKPASSLASDESSTTPSADLDAPSSAQ